MLIFPIWLRSMTKEKEPKQKQKGIYRCWDTLAHTENPENKVGSIIYTQKKIWKVREKYPDKTLWNKQTTATKSLNHWTHYVLFCVGQVLLGIRSALKCGSYRFFFSEKGQGSARSWGKENCNNITLHERKSMSWPKLRGKSINLVTVWVFRFHACEWEWDPRKITFTENSCWIFEDDKKK